MAHPRYLDFDLEIEPADSDRFVAKVVSSPAGETEAVFEWPVTDQDLEIFLLRVGHTRRGVRRSGSPEMTYAREFGKLIYDTVFAGDVGTTLLRSLDEVERQDIGLRLRLRLNNVPQLAAIPWEFLYSDALNRFVIVSTETPVVRYIDLPRPVRPLTVALPLRVLVMISSPTDLPELQVNVEWGRLRESLRPVIDQGLVDVELVERATLMSLQTTLRHSDWHVLHFIGHGAFDETTGEGYLMLEDELGRGRRTSSADLGAIIHDHRSLRLVVLNSCEGARPSAADPFSGVAQGLVRLGIPAVAAMQFEITDDAAILLSQTFYAALADGYPVDAALAEARKVIFSSDNDVEWGTPVLFMRTPNGEIFDVAATAPTAPASVAPPVPQETEEGKLDLEKLDPDPVPAVPDADPGGVEPAPAVEPTLRRAVPPPDSRPTLDRRLVLWAVGVAAVLIIVALLVMRPSDEPETTTTLEAATTTSAQAQPVTTSTAEETPDAPTETTTTAAPPRLLLATDIGSIELTPDDVPTGATVDADQTGPIVVDDFVVNEAAVEAVSSRLLGARGAVFEIAEGYETLLASAIFVYEDEASAAGSLVALQEDLRLEADADFDTMVPPHSRCWTAEISESIGQQQGDDPSTAQFFDYTAAMVFCRHANAVLASFAQFDDADQARRFATTFAELMDLRASIATRSGAAACPPSTNRIATVGDDGTTLLSLESVADVGGTLRATVVLDGVAMVADVGDVLGDGVLVVSLSECAGVFSYGGEQFTLEVGG